MAKNDARIRELLEKIEKQQAEVATKERRALMTNGAFPADDGSMKFNLNTVIRVRVLITALSQLKRTSDFWDAAAKTLNSDEKFSWGGYTYEEWKSDFIMRASEIERQVKKKKLAALKKKLNTLVSEEERTSMELDDIASILG